MKILNPILTSKGEPLTPEELKRHPADSHVTRTRMARLHEALSALVQAYGVDTVEGMLRTVREDMEV